MSVQTVRKKLQTASVKSSGHSVSAVPLPEFFFWGCSRVPRNSIRNILRKKSMTLSSIMKTGNIFSSTNLDPSFWTGPAKWICRSCRMHCIRARLATIVFWISSFLISRNFRPSIRIRNHKKGSRIVQKSGPVAAFRKMT